ncbi:phosphate ABC transporter substrate-binding protein PstS [Limnoglobus roseus]|uniref:Phosphate-binding protein PstS n=1 Tax=Limnoglobus roseus TaxID=2598579 RepID=A0A5C1AJJ8_9BACT|nr:phosphate ABC transporter substrate-binding protein PstS [Limnoglobus roseus]QEL18363.1 phosphate ABC transporter substrate-binding protein PstS [Limnoglobus roseus]
MPHTATAHEFLTAIRESRLLPDAVLEPYQADDDADKIRSRMLADRVLTPYQAKRLQTGRSKGFFLGGKYKLLDHLGSGGMGHVYLCEHLMLHRLVAVKVLHAVAAQAAGFTDRFFREARAVAQLDHPNIARVFDMDRVGSTPFMAMEYVDGSDLHSIVQRHGRLPIARAVHYVYQAACGLDHAHRAGLVHRDIKPANLLLERGGTLKVLDLGLARYFDDASRNHNLTAKYDDRRIIGTADFMAPEQSVDSSAVDIRADLYSLGCTLYFLLTAKLPFEEGNFTQKLLWHQLREPTSVKELRPDVPADVVAVLTRMMAKDPGVRFQTPAELMQILTPYSRPIAPPAAGEMPQTPAAAYRIGLTPPPAVRNGSPPVMSALPVPTSSVDTLASATSATHPTSGGATPPRSAYRRWLIFGTVQLLLLSLGVMAAWLIDRNSRAETTLPPVRRSAPAPSDPPEVLTGGGSTFVQKAMVQWKELYESAHHTHVEYATVGSGEGVQAVLDRKWDFCCTDAYLTPEQLEQGRLAGMNLIHVPLVHGAVVPTYNLREIRHGVRFSGPLLADIYLGRITRWNDPLLQQENPQIAMPDAAIAVVFRSDSSGTTNIWTDFLCKTSDAWRREIGDAATNTPKVWPTGVGARGNDSVAEQVNATYGAIGYVELTHTLGQPKLSIGHVRNRAGVHVQPTLNSVRAAAAAELQRQFPKDFRFNLTDGPAAGTYPIAGTTWAVFDAAHPDAEKRKSLLDFLDWVTHAGQAPATLIYYAPLPEELALLIEATLQRLRIAP